MKTTMYRLYKKYLKIRQLERSAISLTNQTIGRECDFDSCFHLIKKSIDFAPVQKQAEARSLFDLIRHNKPKVLCEIGGLNGGNLFLIGQAAEVGEIFISIDINFPIERRIAHKRLLKRGQTSYCLEGDTQNPKTLSRVQSFLGGRSLDFLFIDGDHSLFGIMNDYIRYSKLVKPGGVIAFHDIHLIHNTHLKDSNLYVGGVPGFWSLLKEYSQNTCEFIEDKNQDGFGIGVLIQP